MKSALEVHNRILEESQTKNHQELRVIDTMKVGQKIRQGDVYVERIDEIPANNAPTMNLQIAVGETKGSRHILQESPSLRVFKLKEAGPLDGPAFSSNEEVVLTHPEHAHFKLPAGNYRSFYQRDFQAEEIRAVRD